MSRSIVGATAVPSFNIPSLKMPSLASPSAAPASSGGMSPAQLAALDRALTPSEQKIVDDWQSGQADASEADEERSGGPLAAIKVGPAGAVLSKINDVTSSFTPIQLIVGGVGIVAIGLGVFGMFRKKR